LEGTMRISVLKKIPLSRSVPLRRRRLWFRRIILERFDGRPISVKFVLRIFEKNFSKINF